MSMPRETESGLGPNPVSLEEARIFKLHPNTVIVGLGNLLDKRIIPLLKKEQLTTEEDWQLQANMAVGSLIDPNVCEYAFMPGDKDYQQAVSTALRYMRFLGFPDNELTAERITAEEDEVKLLVDPKGQEGESGIIYFRQRDKRPLNVILAAAASELKEAETIPAYKALQERNEHLSVRNKALEAQLDKMLGIDDQLFLLLLESLTGDYEQPPTYKQMMEDINGAEKLYQAVMNSKPRRRKA